MPLGGAVMAYPASFACSLSPAYLAAKAMGEETGSSVEEAEAGLLQAQNDLEVARRTKSALESRIEREHKVVQVASREIDEAVARVFIEEGAGSPNGRPA